MNHIKHGIAAAVMLLAGGAANAEFTTQLVEVSGGAEPAGTMTPSGLGGVRFSHSSGFYAGLASANADVGVDAGDGWHTYAGFIDTVGNELGWDAGVSLSRDPHEGSSHLMKLYGGVSYKLFSTQLSLANDHLDGDAQRTLLEAGFNFKFPEGFDLGVRVGHSRFDGKAGLADYTDYRLTVSKQYAGFGLGFDLTRSGFAETDDNRYGRLGDSRFNFTLTKSF